MPASAFIPLLIIWFGIDENEKLAVIFIGVFFPLTLLIADVSANVPRELVQIAYTLGASRWAGLLARAAPGVVARDRRQPADRHRLGVDVPDRRRARRELRPASGTRPLVEPLPGDGEILIAGILTIGLLSDAFFRILDGRCSLRRAMSSIAARNITMVFGTRGGEVRALDDVTVEAPDWGPPA